MDSNKEVYILANGCPESRIDATGIQKFLKQNGYGITGKLQQADIILFNACAHTQNSENGSIEIINHIKLIKKPSAKLVICGCLPKINKERLITVYRGIAFDSNEEKKLNEIFKQEINFENIQSNSLLYLTKSLNKYKWALTNLREKGLIISILKLIEKKQNDLISVCRPHTFFIKVSSGCLGDCSFCAIRLSRGRLKSKPLEEVVGVFEEGLKKGYKDFALIGTEVGAYGKDLGTDLVALLKELINKKGEYKVRLRNVHPRYLIEMLPELRKIFQTGKISFLSCALESGNNRILRLMNRGYKIEDFKAAIRTLNKEFPELQIRTQVMVGFPTETEEEFQDTVKLIDELCFDFVEVYMFQPRPGTKAATMAGQIPQSVIKRRCLKLLLKLFFKRHKRKI